MKRTLVQLFGRVAIGAALFAANAIPAVTPGPGSIMADGTVYSGISSDTLKPVYTTTKDAPGRYAWGAATRYCDDLKAGGHDDWRVPNKPELATLFDNRAAIGGFNRTGQCGAGWYWSATPALENYAWSQRFSDGNQNVNDEDTRSSLRCVRG
jgi:hypothetical protein